MDHTRPVLSAGGTLTEQGSVGTKLSSYSLSYAAADGEEAEPAAGTPIGTTGTGSGQLQRPMATAVDSSGDTYVVDRENKRVEEFDPSGKFVRQFDGTLGGGMAFSDPRGIAISSVGNVWVADLATKYLQEFNPKGEFIRKFTYEGGTFGIAKFVEPYSVATGPNETLWVTDVGSKKVYRFREDGTPLGVQSGMPVGTALESPIGVATDAYGDAWVTDKNAKKVYEFDSSGKYLFSFGTAGTGEGQLSEPIGVAVAKSGNLFVVDAIDNRVEEFKPGGEFLRQFGAAGSGANQLSEPRGIAVAPGNEVVIADAGNHRGARWAHADKDPQSGVAKVVVKVDGKVAKEEAPGCATKDCAINGIWTLDANNYSAGSHEVTVTATDGVGLSTTKTVNVSLNPAPPALSLSGTITEQATLGATRPRYVLQAEASPNDWGGEAWSPAFIAAFGATGSAEGQLNGPRGVASDGKGHVWVVDRANNRVEEFNESGEYLGQFGGSGTGDGKFNNPWGIAVTPAGNIWVTDTGNGRVQEFNSKGEFIQKFGTKTAGESKGTELREPEGIAVTSGGMLWVADCSGNRVAEFRESVSSESERFIRNATGLSYKAPVGVAVDAAGNVWVAEEGSNHLLEFGPEGTFARSVGSFGSADGQLNTPAGVGVGPSGNVYVVDLGNNRVDVFSPEGKFLTKFGTAGTGNAQMNEPRAIGFGAGGAMFVSDKGNNRIHKWGAPWEGPPSFLSAFGSTGSGEGQLNGPRGVAADGKGHVWVVDRANNRVEEFEEATGKYLGQFGGSGTGNGQFNSPWGIAVSPAGNIWVADTGNQRLQEFNPEGKFIQKFGTKAPVGSQGTELLEPEGIAVTGNGMLWVTDCSGNRVAEFRESVSTESERFVRNAGGTTISAPVGVAVDGSGDVWVAEETANHLLEFDAEGSFLRSTGTTGQGNGQLSTPEGIGVGPSGDVYAVDLGNNRVDVFNRNGQFLTKFGTAGTGAGNFSEPRAIAFGASGAIFVSDKGNNRVHKWSQPVPPDQVAGIEVKVDGKAVGTTVLGCASSSCGLGREWVLNSGEYLGGHTVTVKATTVAGWTATKTLAVEEKRDEAAPTLETGGSLINAPEGWVQQESYGYTATAGDTGYGVASIKLKIDGSVVAYQEGQCKEGACPLSLSGSLNTSSYKGGEHQAELLATDAAGNWKRRAWTLRVDPKGPVAAPEATATLEAAEETTPPAQEFQPVAATAEVLEAQEIEAGDNPHFVEEEGTLISTGVATKTEVDRATGAVEIEGTEGPLHLEPLAEVSSAALIEDSAAVLPSTGVAADTVVRPEYNGAEMFTTIRSATAPEDYAWRLSLRPGQYLEPVDGQHVRVNWENGHEAWMIDAEPAHDALGHAVATTLEMTESDVVTLTVHHREASVVYPVSAGEAYVTEYAVVTVYIPPTPEESAEGYEEATEGLIENEPLNQSELEDANGFEPWRGTPQHRDKEKPVPLKQAKQMERYQGLSTASASGHVKEYPGELYDLHVGMCSGLNCPIWQAKMDEGTIKVKKDAAEYWSAEGCHGNINFWWSFNLEINWEEANHRKNEVKRGSGEHITYWCRFAISVFFISDAELPIPDKLDQRYSLQDWVFPNGFQARHVYKRPPELLEA